MPTISSRPPVVEDNSEEQFSIDEIAGIITDGIMYVMPKTMQELRLALHVLCRTLWNTGTVDDFFIYDGMHGGCDVGFKVHGDPHYHVITIH